MKKAMVSSGDKLMGSANNIRPPKLQIKDPHPDSFLVSPKGPVPPFIKICVLPYPLHLSTYQAKC